MAPSGSIRMNVTGQLVLDPENLETVLEHAVAEVVPEIVEEAVQEAVPDALESLEGIDYYGGD